jgi:hypothetical protein
MAALENLILISGINFERNSRTALKVLIAEAGKFCHELPVTGNRGQ